MIAIDRGQHLDIYTPYNREFVAELKEVIPWRGRSWLDEERAWRIHKDYQSRLMDLLHEYFSHVELIDPRTTAHQPPPSPQPQRSHTPNQCRDGVISAYPDHAALWVIPGAPHTVMNAAYRVLSRACHPDCGGTHEAMVRPNAAYSRVKDWPAW